jgi:MFS family permease
MKNEQAKATSFRNIFANLSIFQFLTFARRGVFYSFMIDYLFRLMHTVTSTTILGTMNMVASALGQNLLWGRICDRFKTRTQLIVIGETIAAFTYLTVFLTHRFFIGTGNGFMAGMTIIFGLSILEFFWSMSDVGWATLLTDVTTPQTRGKIVGTLNFIASLGRMAGILFAGSLYNDGEGFRNGTIFYIVIVLLVVGAALIMWLSRHVEASSPAQQRGDILQNGEGKGGFNGANEKTYKWFLISLVTVVLGAASINQVFILFINLPAPNLAASDQAMSLILSAWTVGGMIASLASGRLADKIGRRKVMLLGLVLTAITPLAYGFASNVPLMILAYGLNGVAFWIIQTVGFVIAGDTVPQHKRGRLLSMYNTVMALSWGPAGLLIGGPLADTQVGSFGLSEYSAYVNTFCVSAAIVMLGTVLFVLKVNRIES